MASDILLVSGYGGGEQRLQNLGDKLRALGLVTVVPGGADTDLVRDAYTQAAKRGAVSVVGVGAGCVQALMIAQAFEVEKLALALPGADGRVGPVRPRMMAMNNLFAVIAPTLVVDRPQSRLGKRIYQGVGARDRLWALPATDQEAVQTIIEHLCPNPATQSLANQHNLGII